VNSCIDLLRSLFNQAIKGLMMTRNPGNLTFLKVSARAMNWWEDWHDFELFLRTTRFDRFGFAYRLAIESGLRLSEIVRPSKRDIDFERSQIHIHRQWVDKLQA
jgi:integrase